MMIAEPTTSARERYDRTVATVADRVQQAETLAAQIAANAATQHANEAQRAALASDLAAMPERLTNARAELLVDPGSERAQARLEALQRAQSDGQDDLAALGAEHDRLVAEHDRLTTERAELVALLPSLEAMRREAWAAVGAERRVQQAATLAEREATAAAARVALAEAEAALADAQEAAAVELRAWPQELGALEASHLVPRSAGNPAAQLLEAYAAFMGVALEHGRKVNVSAIQAAEHVNVVQLLAPHPVEVAGVLAGDDRGRQMARATIRSCHLLAERLTADRQPAS